MADPRHLLGRAAEEATAAWLMRCGWRILERRHRSPAGGEVDLLALDPAGVLVALEVRARRARRAGPAAESVDGRRVRRLERTLASYAASAKLIHAGLRIDLVTAEPVVGRGEWRLHRMPGIGGP